MLEPHSSPSGFRWRRTAVARIDGAGDIAEDDWSLVIGGMSAARIYRVRGGSHDGRWFWAVQIGPGRVPFNIGTGNAAGRRARLARRSCGQWETPKRRSRRARRSPRRRPGRRHGDISRQGPRTGRAREGILAMRSGRLLNGHGVRFCFIGGDLEKNTNFEGSLVDALRSLRA